MPALPPSPSVRVDPESVTSPTVIAPVPEDSSVVLPREKSPRVMAALVVARVPAVETDDGEVAVSPPRKVRVSAASSPSTSAPVLLNTVASAMVAPPRMDRP